MPPRRTRGAELPPVIRGLLRPGAYPHPTGRVRLVQTHISYLLLAGDYVYKVKKPVAFGFLDFSTLGKRRYYCRQEVVLNSRLCAETYLGVVSVRDDGGRITMGARTGRIVEYAVQMRRLPEERMMDRLLALGELTLAMVRQVADKLAAFHTKAETSRRIAEYGDWAIRYNWQENEAQWRPYIGRALTAEQDRTLRAYARAFYARRRELLERRVAELRIKRVHADLRSDAVCFREKDDVCIYDCVEFSRRINQQDVARDAGFLAMDLDYRGREELSRAFVDRYVEVSGDVEMRDVLDFYAAYSACVRGKVEAFLLDEPEVAEAQKRRGRRAARRYFELACRYAESLPPAMLVITCGLAGSGKSTLAAALVGAAGFTVLRSDKVRKELGRIDREEHRQEAFEAGIYGREFTARTYEAMFERARPLLLEGRSVILDATFLRREHRRGAARLGRETGAQFACLELRISDRAARERLGRRARLGASVSDARWETYREQKRQFQRPTEVELERRIVIDAQQRLRSQMRVVVKALKEVSPLSV